jgi:diaminopimelate epimerase
MLMAKLHGLGNDFLVIKKEDVRGSSLKSLARRVCQRYVGIGADGVVFFQPTPDDAAADVSALIFNADGSRAEMSGNGTRCLAAYLVRSGEIAAKIFRIRTVSGIKSFTLTGRKDRTYTFESSLGCPEMDSAKIPVRLGTRPDQLIDFPLTVGGEVLRVTISSMGNPHCSTFWPDVAKAPVETLGPVLEGLRCFPNRTNVEFIQVMDRHRIRVRFWERGVGPTLASGTGSAAAAVAAILNSKVESPVTVEVDLGGLLVRWKPPCELLLTGPAEFICNCDLPD